MSSHRKDEVLSTIGFDSSSEKRIFDRVVTTAQQHGHLIGTAANAGVTHEPEREKDVQRAKSRAYKSGRKTKISDIFAAAAVFAIVAVGLISMFIANFIQQDSPVTAGSEIVTGLFEDASPETSVLQYFIHDGNAIRQMNSSGTKTIEVVQKYGSDEIIEIIENDHTEPYTSVQSIIDTLNAVEAVKVDDWSFDDITLPVYGVSIGSTSGFAIAAAWSNGLLFTQDGAVYSFDFDFASLEADYIWRDAGVSPSFAYFPCARVLALKDNEWNLNLLTPAPEYSPPFGIAVSLENHNDNTITLAFSNNSGDEWMHGEHYAIEVLLGEIWYRVPAVPGDWGFNSVGYLVQDGDTESMSYNLTIYGELPDGAYRILTEGLTAEFTLPEQSSFEQIENTPLMNDDYEGITFVFKNEQPLEMELLPNIFRRGADEIAIPVEGRVFSKEERAVAPYCSQGFYCEADDEEHRIYAYIKTTGGEFYELGQVAYGSDDTTNNLLSVMGGPHWLTFGEIIDINGSDAVICQLYKTYGAKYDAVAYYLLKGIHDLQGLAYSLCEIVGVVNHIYDETSGSEWIISTDRSLPFTGCTISEIDIDAGVLRFTNLTELLECDSVSYDSDSGLFYIYHMLPDMGNEVKMTETGIYSFNGRVFTPAEYYDVAYKAAYAMLNANADNLSAYLADPAKAENFISDSPVDTIENTEDRFIIHEQSVNLIYGDYPFMLKGDDSYTYVFIYMERIDNTWKVTEIGFQK